MVFRLRLGQRIFQRGRYRGAKTRMTNTDLIQSLQFLILSLAYFFLFVTQLFLFPTQSSFFHPLCTQLSSGCVHMILIIINEQFSWFIMLLSILLSSSYCVLLFVLLLSHHYLYLLIYQVIVPMPGRHCSFSRVLKVLSYKAMYN